MNLWQRIWPYLVAVIGGFGLAWVLIAVFIFPPGAPPGDGTIPNVIGLNFDVASQRLQQAGFKAKRGEMRFQDAAPKLSVVQMTPDQGTRGPLGSEVTLDLSAGPRPDVVPNSKAGPPTSADSSQADSRQADSTIAVPDLAGSTIVEARVLLDQLGLSLGDVTILKGGGNQDHAIVVQQAPAKGTLVPAGARVTISVSGDNTP